MNAIDKGISSKILAKQMDTLLQYFSTYGSNTNNPEGNGKTTGENLVEQGEVNAESDYLPARAFKISKSIRTSIDGKVVTGTACVKFLFVERGD